MAKYKEIVSMVLDELKVTSDDSIFTEGHIIFLARIYRSFLLKQRYSTDLKKVIPEVPTLVPFGNTRLYTSGSYYKGNIEFVSKDRFKNTGYNKWLQNIIYATLDPSGRIYLNSANPQFLYLCQATLYGIFEDADKASELECDNQGNPETCDILERDFPLEEALIAPLIELITKELSPSIAAPEDKDNNANDELSQNR